MKRQFLVQPFLLFDGCSMLDLLQQLNLLPLLVQLIRPHGHLPSDLSLLLLLLLLLLLNLLDELAAGLGVFALSGL